MSNHTFAQTVRRITIHHPNGAVRCVLETTGLNYVGDAHVIVPFRWITPPHPEIPNGGEMRITFKAAESLKSLSDDDRWERISHALERKYGADGSYIPDNALIVKEVDL